MIPFLAPDRQNRGLGPTLAARVNEWLSSPEQTLRSERDLVEKALSAVSGYGHAVTVSSGFEGLLISLLALRLPAGSTILISSAPAQEAAATMGLQTIALGFSKPATAAEVTAKLTSQVRAVVLGCPFGQQAESEAIRRLCIPKGIYLIEESALGLPNHRPNAALVSFSPRSVLSVPGTLAALLTEDAVFATRARELRSSRQAGGEFWNLALLRAKLPKLASYLSLRRSIAQWYLAAFEMEFARRKLDLPLWPKDSATHVWESFAVGVSDPQALRDKLQRAGVETSVPLPGTPFLALPFYPELSGKEVQQVVACVQSALDSPKLRTRPRPEASA